MNFRYSQKEEAFRAEVKEFLKDAVTQEVREGGMPGLISTPARRDFVTKMAKKGWLAMSFPKEYGGSEMTMPLAQYVLNQELQLARAPIVGKNLGIIGNVILHHGTEELKKEFLPRIVRNELQWGLTYTEPEAGSDLANMQCKAVREGDHFVINGAKRFITSAHFSDYLWVAVRTDPNLPKHKGISLIIVKTDSPGITIVPMYMMSGERTSEVFFDNVKTPAKYLVGELNRGWYYVSEALDYERFAIISFTPNLQKFQKMLDWVKKTKRNGKPLKDDPVIRRKVAEMKIRLEIGRMLELRCISMAVRPEYVPNIEATMNKIWGSLFGPDLDDMMLDMAGPYGYLWNGEDSVDGGEWTRQWTGGPHSRTAAAGVDVAKNIIAKRALKLPSA